MTEPGVDNVAITVKAAGSSKEFSALLVKYIPDLHLVGDTQVFPLYRYKELTDDKSEWEVVINKHLAGKIVTAPSGKRYVRIENITDWALNEYRRCFSDDVTKEDIFYYVYGILHSREYRERYRNELKKMLPRIPFISSIEDFWAFSNAGRRLAELHLNYETIEPCPLKEEINGDPDDLTTYKISKMRFRKTRDRKDDKTTIIYNENITLSGIPLEAYEYVVNGKPAIEWVMERYKVSRDRKSGIINDPNKWLEEQGNPRYIVDLIKRLVRVSIETMKIVEGLPSLNID